MHTPRAARAWLRKVGDGADGGADVGLAHVVVRGVRRSRGGRSHSGCGLRRAAARGRAASRCVGAYRRGSGAHNEARPPYRRGRARQARPSRDADARTSHRLAAVPLTATPPDARVRRYSLTAVSRRCAPTAALAPPACAPRQRFGALSQGVAYTCAARRRMTAPPQRAPLLLDLRTRLRLSLAATMAVRLRGVGQGDATGGDSDPFRRPQAIPALRRLQDLWNQARGAATACRVSRRC